jgi:hypothetical protein
MRTTFGQQLRAAVLTCVTLFVLVHTSPAEAEFTDAEKASESHLRASAVYIASALQTYVAYTFNAFVTQSTQRPLTTAALTTLKAMDEINDGYSALAGDVSTDQEDTPRFNRLETSRDLRLQVTRDKVERLKWIIPQAISEWDTARSANRDATYQDYTWRVRETLRYALIELQRFDTNLAYRDPKPPADPRFPATTVIGPHGVFRVTHWERWRGRVYTIRAMADLIAAVAAGPMTSNRAFSFVNSGRALMTLGWVVEASIDETAHTSGMGSTIDPFGRTLETLRVMQSKYTGIPGAMHFFHFDLRDVFLTQMGRNAAFDSAVMDAIVILADAWSHFDESSWQLNIFPGCPPTCVAGR